MTANGWKQPSIPEALADRAERYIKENPGAGFKSLSAFVTDAVREKLDSLSA